MQLLLYPSAPELTHPFIGAPILSIHKSRKSDVFTSFPYSTLSSRNFRLSVRPSCYPSSVLIHSWNRIFSSGFRKCMWSSVPLVQLSRLILVFSLASILEGEAYGKPGPPSTYSCDDIQSYYSSAQHKKGKPLKKALHVIVEGHQSLSYKEVWDALKILDASEVNDPESSSGIVEIYSLRVVSKQLAGKSEGWNREHLWPRSYGLAHGPSLTDLHNIRAADVNVNSSRGNKYFGECCNDSIDCLKPANKEAALDTEADKEKWAPPKQVRGDIARALMYMAVRYGFHEPGSPVLKLSDSPSTKAREMGLLSTLLKWNEIDPPSREEKMRNERICKIYQHNRNPFVDHPEYAKLIWKQGNPSCQRLHQSQMTPLKQRTSRFESNRVAKKTLVSWQRERV